VPGGSGNQALGSFSFAAGNSAGALHDNAFVWSDGSTYPFESTGHSQFLIRAAGGVGINTTNPVVGSALDVKDAPGSNSGHIHVGGDFGGPTAGPQPKLISFGDRDFVHVGENGADDRMELMADTFFFTTGHPGVAGAGRVGIGTATPHAELDVAGTARMN